MKSQTLKIDLVITEINKEGKKSWRFLTGNNYNDIAKDLIHLQKYHDKLTELKESSIVKND